MPQTVPDAGQLVTVRNRLFVVADVDASDLPAADLQPLSQPQHLITLKSVEDGGIGDELRVIWELEPGARPLPSAGLPSPTAFDPPERLEAFLDAIRWGAIASAEVRRLQSPFRAGIEIEDYQLEPVIKALEMPRVSLLVADDVGLGKTIEAGMVALELMLRHRTQTILIVCPAHQRHAEEVAQGLVDENGKILTKKRSGAKSAGARRKGARAALQPSLGLT